MDSRSLRLFRARSSSEAQDDTAATVAGRTQGRARQGHRGVAGRRVAWRGVAWRGGAYGAQAHGARSERQAPTCWSHFIILQNWSGKPHAGSAQGDIGWSRSVRERRRRIVSGTYPTIRRKVAGRRPGRQRNGDGKKKKGECTNLFQEQVVIVGPQPSEEIRQVVRHSDCRGAGAESNTNAGGRKDGLVDNFKGREADGT